MLTNRKCLTFNHATRLVITCGKKTKFSHSYYSINEIRWWQIKNTPEVHLCACKFTAHGRCEGVEVSTIMDWGKYHTPFGWL